MIDRIERGVLGAMERAAKIEKAIGGVTIEELRHHFRCVGETLHQYGPPDTLPAAMEYLTERLRSRDHGRHGRLRTAGEPPE